MVLSCLSANNVVIPVFLNRISISPFQEYDEQITSNWASHKLRITILCSRSRDSNIMTVLQIWSVQSNIASCNANHGKSHNYQPLEIRFAPKCVWSQVQIAWKQPSWCLRVTTNGVKLQKGNSSITSRLLNVPFHFPEETAIESITECWFPMHQITILNAATNVQVQLRVEHVYFEAENLSVNDTDE